jgi:hypothetical protein
MRPFIETELIVQLEESVFATTRSTCPARIYIDMFAMIWPNGEDETNILMKNASPNQALTVAEPYEDIIKKTNKVTTPELKIFTN